MEKREAGRKCLDEDFPFFIEFYVKLANMAGSTSQFSHPSGMGAMTTTGIERAQYLPLLWPVLKSGAAVEPNDVILTNLMTSY